MLSSEVVSWLMGFGGFLLGSFIPLALVYLGVYLKKHKFGWKTFFGMMLRIIAIPVVFVLLMIIVSLTLQLAPVDAKGIPIVSGTPLVVALMLGLLGGVSALVYGIVVGIRSTKHREGKT